MKIRKAKRRKDMAMFIGVLGIGIVAAFFSIEAGFITLVVYLLGIFAGVESGIIDDLRRELSG
jgi:phage shock protein PspC (stress-responsive transcriptional regulator)